MIKSAFSILSIAVVLNSSAQERAVSGGGDGTGSGGSVSFSLGLVDFTNYYSGSLAVTEGLQQPYEINSIGIENILTITIQVYPNPVQDLLIIEQFSSGEADISGQLYDSRGKLIWEGTLNNTHNYIDLKALPAASYLLQLTLKESATRTYQLIKL